MQDWRMHKSSTKGRSVHETRCKPQPQQMNLQFFRLLRHLPIDVIQSSMKNGNSTQEFVICGVDGITLFPALLLLSFLSFCVCPFLLMICPITFISRQRFIHKRPFAIAIPSCFHSMRYKVVGKVAMFLDSH